MEIKFLKQLDLRQQQTQLVALSQLSQDLNLSMLNILNLTARINLLEPGLIRNLNGKYQLQRQMNWLDHNLIHQKLVAAQLAHQVLVIDQIESTNSYALNNDDRIQAPALVTCEWQFAGRGRFGRRWLAPLAHDLTISYIYQFAAEFNLSLLPLLVAVAINRLLKNYGWRSQIKWPNDIYVDQRKIAGVLVENLVRKQHNYTVIGIGLANLNNCERNQLIVDLTLQLQQIIREFEIIGFATLRREWLDNCLHLGKNVTISHNGTTLAHGIHQDITEHGELVITTQNGAQTFTSSSISLIID